MPDGQRSRLYDSQCLHDAMEHSWIFVGLQISPERSNARKENLHHLFYQNSTDVDSWLGNKILTVLPGATMHSCLFEGANNSSTKNDPKKVQHLYIDRYIVQSSNESFFLSNEKFTCVGCFVQGWRIIAFWGQGFRLASSHQTIHDNNGTAQSYPESHPDWWPP